MESVPLACRSRDSHLRATARRGRPPRGTVAAMRIALVTESFFPAVDGTTTTRQGGRRPARRRRPRGRWSWPRPGPDVLPRLPGRPDPAAGASSAAAGAGGARRRSAPDLVHVTSPGTLGRKALKHARRLGFPTLVVRAVARPELAADYWRAKVADRADHVLVTVAWMRRPARRARRRAGLWRPGVDTAAFTPAAARRPGCTTAGRGRARPTGRGSSSATSASLRKRHGVRRLAEVAAGARHPAGRRSATARSGAGSQDRLPGANFTGALADRRPGHRAADARRAGPPRRARRPAATRCARPPPAACRSWRPRAGGAIDVVRHLETGLLYDPAEPARPAPGGGHASSATGTARLLGVRGPRAVASPRTGGRPSTSWSTGTTPDARPPATAAACCTGLATGA